MLQRLYVYVAGNAAESALAEHIQSIVYELHKVTPQMLVYILPNIADQLQAEETDVSRTGHASKHCVIWTTL